MEKSGRNQLQVVAYNTYNLRFIHSHRHYSIPKVIRK